MACWQHWKQGDKTHWWHTTHQQYRDAPVLNLRTQVFREELPAVCEAPRGQQHPPASVHHPAPLTLHLKFFRTNLSHASHYVIDDVTSALQCSCFLSSNKVPGADVARFGLGENPLVVVCDGKEREPASQFAGLQDLDWFPQGSGCGPDARRVFAVLEAQSQEPHLVVESDT